MSMAKRLGKKKLMLVETEKNNVRVGQGHSYQPASINDDSLELKVKLVSFELTCVLGSDSCVICEKLGCAFFAVWERKSV